jgi:hypothetical protein
MTPMNSEPLQEDLLDELTRLVARPRPLVQDVLARLLGTLTRRFDPPLLAKLGSFPMTAWPAISAPNGPARDLWSCGASAGLSPEEVFTTLAVLDDHIRRRYGSDSWSRLSDWAPRLACRYGLATNPSAGEAARTFPSL